MLSTPAWLRVGDLGLVTSGLSRKLLHAPMHYDFYVFLVPVALWMSCHVFTSFTHGDIVFITKSRCVVQCLCCEVVASCLDDCGVSASSCLSVPRDEPGFGEVFHLPLEGFVANIVC